ncbi:MAG: BTAD domain-containing putative transcriptional regulator [Deltaproteobacteria bacterium]|nr:BTAD domain-containing putative transcriptional regulator [Deltaproteobacteria bacterium]
MTDPAPTTRLSLRFFGQWSAHWEDEPLALRQQQALLLTRIALDERPVSRATLLATFWPRGRAQSLRQALYTLRALPGAAQWLHVSDESIAVIASSDYQQFYTAFALGDFDTALAQVSEGFAVDTASASQEFLCWLDEVRDRLRVQVRMARLSAARARIAREDFFGALAAVDPGLAEDALDEPLAREGMRACAAMGQAREALDRYERFRQALLRELGAEPCEETDLLANSLAKHLRAAPDSVAPWPASLALSAASSTALPSRDVPLVGRESPLRALSEARAQGRSVLLMGEPGIGKSHILRALLADAPAEPQAWAAHEIERGHAFASARRWLGPNHQDAFEVPVRDAAAVVRSTLHTAQLRAAVSTALHPHCSAHRLLTLDDLHNVDELSALALLDTLARPDVSIVLTARTDALSHAVRAEITALSQAQRLTVLSLERLDVHAVATLAAHYLPQDDPALHQALVAQTGRLPLLVTLACQDLAQRGPDAQVRPPSVARWVAQRLARLPLTAQRCAQWLSIVEVAEDSVLLDVLQISSAELEQSLALLESEQLVRGRALDYPLLREAVRETVSLSVRNGWHRAAAAHFEAQQAHERAAEHWVQCEQPARAVRGLLDRADRALAVFATDEAREALDRASAHVRDNEDRLRYFAGREALAACETDVAARERSLSEFADEARSQQHEHAMIEASLRRLAFLREQSRYEESVELAAAVISECERADLDAPRLRALSERSMSALRLGQMDAAHADFVRLSQCSDPVAQSTGLYGLGAVHGYRLELNEARTLHEAVLTMARARRDLGLIARALNGLAATAERAGQRRLAATRFTEAASLAQSVRAYETVRLATLNAAMASAQCGQLGASLGLLARSAALGPSEGRAAALEAQIYGEVLLELGMFAQARVHFAQSAAVAHAIGEARRVAHATLNAAFGRERFEDCVAEVEAVLRDPAMTSDVALLTLAELALVAPTKAQALAILARVKPVSGPVAELIVALAALRAGGAADPSLEATLERTESGFVVLGWSLLAARTEGARARAARKTFETVFAGASEGLTEAQSRRWRAWIVLRSSRTLQAPWRDRQIPAKRAGKDVA